MNMTYLQQMAVLPAILVALAGLLALRTQGEEKAKRRFLILLLGITVLFMLSLVVTQRWITEPFNQPFFQLARLLTASLAGVLALIILNLKSVAGMNRNARIITALLGLAIIILFSLLWNSQGLGFLILPGALVLAVGWALGARYGRLAVVLSLISLVMLWLFNQLMSHPPDYTTGPPLALRFLFLFGFYISPGVAVVMSGVLITTSLQPAGAPEKDGASIHSRRVRLFTVGLAFSLLIYLAYTIFWGSVWDQTSDGLFGSFVSQQAGIIGVGVGMVMTVTLSGKSRLAGLLFILVVPVLFYRAFEAGWQVSYHEITERRAARIAQALDRFRARQGHYPETLAALTPRDMLSIQQPVILAGETWCYQGGEDFYRLAAFHREFFSSPVSLRVYEMAGEPPADPWPCEAELAAMKERYYSPMEDPAAMRPPLPTPLPEIEVGIPKTVVQPVLNGIPIAPGSWSPDSANFVFGAKNGTLTLHFLNGRTGEICTADGNFTDVETLRNHHAWLPDGRLLYVDGSGDMVVLAPCQPEVERLTDRFPETFTQIGAYAPETGRALLQSETAYWILDGRTLSVTPIPEVTPNPYELHWDNFAWLPGGERLVIARLDGRRGSNAGSTLYLVAGDTGQVESSLPLAGDFGQSAPWMEALAEQAILIHSSGDWSIIDFSVVPPQSTNVLADLFGLDVHFPNDMSASASVMDKAGSGYYLAVRLNHPRNQATYLYHSETGRADVYNHDHHTLLLFPGGELVGMPKQEDVTTYRDEYDLVLVDTPEITQPRLIFTGHTPREYPHLSIKYLVATSQIAVASAHGVSLVSLPDGEMVMYWTLLGDGFSPWLIASPDGSALVAAKDYGGLYYLPLREE